MKKVKLLAVVAGAILVSGCSGPYDNTQAGAALGAVTGAVVGYNTKNHHHGRNAAIGAAAGALAGGLVGNAVDTRKELNRRNAGWQ
jgi:uncharacterized protein YcfJ